MSPQDFPELDQDQGPSSRARRALRGDRRNLQAIAIAAVPIVILVAIVALGIWLIQGRSRGANVAPTPTLLPTTKPATLVAAVKTTTPATELTPVATATFAPTQAPTLAAVATNTPAVATDPPTATAIPSDALAPGVTAEVTDTAGRGLRVRTAAGLNAATIKVLPDGSQVTILEGPTEMDGYQWYSIRDEANVEGWVAADWLLRVP